MNENRIVDAKRRKTLCFVCVMLTAIVAHTALRIELLKARCNYYLPRTAIDDGHPKWRVAAPESVRHWIDREIANERHARFKQEHPDEQGRDSDQFVGPPYTSVEQQMIDTAMTENQQQNALRNWVSTFGLLQYVLAPLTLCLSLACLRVCQNSVMRPLAVACAISTVAAIGSMIYRGYFKSLGW